MATYYSTGYPDPATPRQVPVDHKGARLRVTPSYSLPGAAPALNEKIYLGKIPSSARLLDIGTIKYGAFGGSAAAILGFEHAKMTSAEVTAAKNVLWTASSVVSAGSRSVMASVSLANLQKRAWQLAGLTVDPGGEIDVVLAFSTAAASAVAVQADIVFATD